MPVNWRLWLKVAGVALALLILYRAYSCVSKTVKSVKDEFATATTVDNSTDPSTKSSDPSSTSNSGGGITIAAAIQPVFLDVKANLQGFELLETRYYPAAGESRLVFLGKFYRDNAYDINLSNTQFELIADGKLYETKFKDFQNQRHSNYGTLTATGFAHILVEIAYDIPANVQKLDWKIKIVGTATIPVDIHKTLTAPPVLPKLVNLTEEKDLNVSRVFSKEIGRAHV